MTKEIEYYCHKSSDELYIMQLK